MMIRKGKRVLWKRHETADSVFSRLRGIMFRDRVREPLLFPFPVTFQWGIHSFFCPQFDAIFLNEKKKIVEIVPRIKPNNHVTPKGEVRYLIECAPGEAKTLGLKVGDSLSF